MFTAIRRALPTGFVPLCHTCHDAWVGSFLLIVIAAIILAGIVFGAAAFTLGRDRGLTPPRPDGVPFDLPPDRPLDRADVEDLRFDTALRGYRMSQVDSLLQRVSDDLDFLYARIADLEDQLAGPVEDIAEPELELPSWVESGPDEGDPEAGSSGTGEDRAETGQVGAGQVGAGQVGAAEREVADLEAADLDAEPEPEAAVPRSGGGRG